MRRPTGPLGTIIVMVAVATLFISVFAAGWLGMAAIVSESKLDLVEPIERSECVNGAVIISGLLQVDTVIGPLYARMCQEGGETTIFNPGGPGVIIFKDEDTFNAELGGGPVVEVLPNPTGGV